MTCSIEFSLAGLLWISVYALVGGALLGVSEAIAANLLKTWGREKEGADTEIPGAQLEDRVAGRAR